MKILFKYALILIAAFSLLIYSCNRKESKSEKPPKKVPMVKVHKVSTSKMITSIDITGTIQANIETEIKSPADGIVATLTARENQYVKKDVLVAIVNPTERVAIISTSIEKVENLERKMKSLDKNSPEYEETIKELENAKLDLDYAKNMFKTIPVICPMNGLVTKRWLDEGSQVSTKETILTITDMSSLVIKAEVNEKYFEVLKRGKKLTIVLNAYPTDTLTGVISLIYPQIDPVSRSVKFDIKIQNFTKTLFPGMMASISIPVSVIDDAISIPEFAVLTSPDNKNFVFVVDEDSIAHKQMVQTGIISGNKIQIVNGLKSNDAIVISGQDMLKDSVKVKILSAPKGEK